MRRWIVLSLLFGSVASPASAQEAESLRRELGELRRQLDTMRDTYQKAIDTLTERLKRIESAPQPATAAPTPAAPTPPLALQAPQAPAQTPSTPLDLARPRQPFSLYERRGSGSLLFDMGIVSDLVANLTQDNVDKADAGTFFGRENRAFPREVELNLYGRIDPYAQGTVRFEFAEEFEDGARATEAHLAEAYFSLLSLPYGFKLSLGQQPVRFGLLSHLHREALPQTDTPNVLLRFLGEEQLRETGAELSWVPPLPFYLEALAGVFTGDNETAFGRGSLKAPLVNGRLRTFFELGDLGAIQLGVSGATGETAARLRQTLAGYDVKYKLTPEAWRHPLLTLGSEGLWSRRRVEELEDVDGDGEVEGFRHTRDRFGWYAYGEVQPWKRWAGGVRYDSTQLLELPGREWAIQPYVTFMLSDFLRFRLGYKHTERDRREPFTANDATARTVDELFFQATFFLGAHAPHPF